MKVSYRGYELEANRKRSLSGWDQLYFSIYRESDGYECSAGLTLDESPVRTYLKHMKERVDAELLTADPWGEKELEKSWSNL